MHPHPRQPGWFKAMERGDIELSPRDALSLWNLYTMMRQRSISRTDLANELGLTKQRIQAMMFEGGESHERLEQAITAVTDARHYDSQHDSSPSACKCPPSSRVYEAAGLDPLQVRKMSEAFEVEKQRRPDRWRFEDE